MILHAHAYLHNLCFGLIPVTTWAIGLAMVMPTYVIGSAMVMPTYVIGLVMVMPTYGEVEGDQDTVKTVTGALGTTVGFG